MSTNSLQPGGNKSPRDVDRLASKTRSLWSRTYVFIKKANVKTWKQVFILAFIAGAIAASVWMIALKVQTITRSAGEVPPTGYTYCATEGGYCSFTGTREVKYGKDPTFVTKTFTNGTDCNNATFTDPLYKTLKYCYYSNATVSSSTPDPTPAPTPLPSPIAHWKFDETSGTVAADSSGKGNSGTLVNGPTWSAGKINGALNFDGTDDYLKVTAGADLSAAANNFSMGGWVNPGKTRSVTTESTGGTAGIRGQSYFLYPAYKGTNAGAGISVGTNGISVFEHGGNYLPSTLVYNTTLSGWNHVLVVYENKKPKLYLNGALVRTGLTSPKANVYPGYTIGRFGSSAYGYYKGAADDVRVYNHALSASEVQALSGGTSVPTLPPTPTPSSPTPSSPTPTGYTYCANEGGQCSFTGTRNVKYGANTTFITKIFTGGTACTNAVFTDPLYKTAKYCYYSNTTVTPTPPLSCGDGSCNNSETCSTCSQDCGTCPVTPPPTSSGGKIEQTTVNGFNDDYLYNSDGTFKIGIRRNWGGSVIFFGGAGSGPGTNNTNVVDGRDQGREIQLSFYDGDRYRQGCAWNMSCKEPNALICVPTNNHYVGWNPVQGGSFQKGSGVQSVTGSNGVLEAIVVPFHWNPYWGRKDCTQVWDANYKAADYERGDLRMKQTMKFIRPRIVQLDYTVTNIGNVNHAGVGKQEFPVVYTSNGQSGPDVYRLFDSTGTEVILTTPGYTGKPGHYSGSFKSPGGWLQRQTKDLSYGLGIYRADHLTDFYAGISLTPARSMRPSINVGFPAGATVSRRFYLMIGSKTQIEQEAAWLKQNGY